MKQKQQRWIWLVCVAVVHVVLGCGGRVAYESTDGKTSWLQLCSDDTECGDNLQCECGVCTRACQSPTDCLEFPTAQCSTVMALRSSCAGSVEAICSIECVRDSDCDALSGDGVCRDGSCTLASSPVGPSDDGTAAPQGGAGVPGAGPPDANQQVPMPDVATSGLEGSTAVPDAQTPRLPAYDEALAMCTLPRQTVYLAQTEEELLGLMLGDWFSCTPGALFDEQEIGIRFLGGGAFELLYAGQDGVVTGPDAAQRGIWQLGDNGTGSGGDPAFQLQQASLPNGGWWIITPRFSDDPLRFDVEAGNGEARFVAASAL